MKASGEAGVVIGWQEVKWLQRGSAPKFTILGPFRETEDKAKRFSAEA